MPNWCFTEIKIIHNDESKLKSLEELISKCLSANYQETDFGLAWLGNIVGNAKIGTVDENKPTDLRCRGSVIEHWLEDNALYIITETAWEPQLKMWLKLIEAYLPGAGLIYSAEECGCGLYSTNDADLQGKYIFDPFDMPKSEIETEATEQHIVGTLQNLLSTQENNIDVLIAMLNHSDYSDRIAVHKWENISEYEWE